MNDDKEMKKVHKYDYEITEDIVEETIARFDQNEKNKEIVLSELFEQYSTNTQFYDVLIKVTVLNSLYSAGLNNNDGSKTIDVVTMTKHIILEPCFDNWLQSDEEKEQIKAYNYIAVGLSEARDENYNKCYAFASKYCSWHRPDIYSIMDSRAKKNLFSFIQSERNSFYGKIR